MTSTVFVDSSVLFAALISDTGHARDLVRLATRGEVMLYTSTYVLREVTADLTPLGCLLSAVRFSALCLLVGSGLFLV